MNKKIMKNKKGFTLIELIVVMAVIGILVLLAAPRFLGYTKDANVSAMKADAKVLENVSLIYNIETENWPLVDSDLVTEGVQATAMDLTAYTGLTTALPVGTDVYEINFEAIKSQVKSLKNDSTKYGIVTSGDLEGTVVHLEGVEDRNAVTHFATDLSDK